MIRFSGVAIVLLSAALAQTTPPKTATLPQAMAKLQSGDAAGAAAMLDEVTASDPKNARAWRMLGVARQKNKEYDKALAAYMRSLEVDANAPATLYNMGTV